MEKKKSEKKKKNMPSCLRAPITRCQFLVDLHAILSSFYRSELKSIGHFTEDTFIYSTLRLTNRYQIFAESFVFFFSTTSTNFPSQGVEEFIGTFGTTFWEINPQSLEEIPSHVQKSNGIGTSQQTSTFPASHKNSHLREV